VTAGSGGHAVIELLERYTSVLPRLRSAHAVVLRRRTARFILPGRNQVAVGVLSLCLLVPLPAIRFHGRGTQYFGSVLF
jgi:hypothetical protein